MSAAGFENPSNARRTSARRIALATLVCLTAASAVVCTGWGWDAPASLSRGAVWFWLALCFGAECLWLRTPTGNATISMASCAHFAAILVLPRPEAMAATLTASLLAEALVLRKPWPRVVFNAAQAALAVGAARACFFALSPAGSWAAGVMVPQHYLALAAAGAVYFLMNHGATSLAVGLDRGISPARVWRENFGMRYEIFSSATLFCLGALLAIQYLSAGALGVIPLVLPVVLAKDGYDRFLASLRRGRPSTEESPREVRDRPAA